MENPIKMDDLRYPYFWKHPYISLPLARFLAQNCSPNKKKPLPVTRPETPFPERATSCQAIAIKL